MSAEHDAEIGRLRRELEQARQELEVLAQEWIAAAASNLSSRWEDEVRSSVTGNPEHTQAVGKESLSALKAQLTTLQARAQEIARAAFDRDDLWSHREPDPDKMLVEPRTFRSLRWDRNRLPDHLESAFAQALAEVEPILEKAGFDPRIVGEHKGKYFLVDDTALSEDLLRATVAYADRLGKRDADIAALHKVKAAKAKAEASDLWEQA